MSEKPPMGMIAITGMGSSAIGDQVGDAIAKILAWIIALNCQCVPPEDVIHACHTICIALVVGIAFWIHGKLLKPVQGE